MIKKIIYFALSIFLALSFSSCSTKNTNSAETNLTNQSASSETNAGESPTSLAGNSPNVNEVDLSKEGEIPTSSAKLAPSAVDNSSSNTINSFQELTSRLTDEQQLAFVKEYNKNLEDELHKLVIEGKIPLSAEESTITPATDRGGKISVIPTEEQMSFINGACMQARKTTIDNLYSNGTLTKDIADDFKLIIDKALNKK